MCFRRPLCIQFLDCVINQFALPENVYLTRGQFEFLADVQVQAAGFRCGEIDVKLAAFGQGECQVGERAGNVASVPASMGFWAVVSHSCGRM